MPTIFGKIITGVEGRVMVPALGAMPGYFSSWRLVAKEDETFEFRATFAYLNQALWDEQSLTKQVFIKIGKDREYRLEVAGDTELKGKQLTMKGVTLNAQ